MLLFSLMISLTALADDCGELADQLTEASPHEAAPMFVQFASCDPKAAAAKADTVLPRLLGGTAGHEAALAAIRAGAAPAARTWVQSLMSDERAPAIRAIGKACEKDASVQAFFTDAAEELGEAFWSERWYRGLAACRVASIQTLLTTQVAKGAGENRSQYFAVVQAWASNLASAAVPKLAEMIPSATEPEIQLNLVQAFADAAQVGTLQGTEIKIADLAAAAITALAPTLPSKVVEQSRITLMALDHEQAADQLAKVRYSELLQKDDTLLYGGVLIESATCKNGKVSQRAHVAEAIDPGQTWPDQLKDKLMASAGVLWRLNLAERCKGEGTLNMVVPDAPFENPGSFRKWADGAIKAATHADVKKPVRVDHDPIEL